MSPGRCANNCAGQLQPGADGRTAVGLSRSMARTASARVAGDATASCPGAGKSCWAVLTPAMMAKRTPSSMQFTAAFAACRAAGIRPSAVIEPEQSTMMISVASAVRRPSEPDEATVTIALTSVAPRARNSFWNASAVYGTRSPWRCRPVRGGTAGCTVIVGHGRQRRRGSHRRWPDRRDRDGDVVAATGGVGEGGQAARGGQHRPGVRCGSRRWARAVSANTAGSVR